jgi:hypothetical protein
MLREVSFFLLTIDINNTPKAEHFRDFILLTTLKLV